ncbi:MAG TPA: AIR synthase related protein [Candidatus Baltobacteraceae bacterium]|nr:AIR synthase related protein [Candidatus Baltobacteraceae bacterium]
MTGNLFAFTRAAAAHLADGGLFRLDAGLALVAHVEGAGARAALASASGRIDLLADDLVARLVNAVLARGAEPLFVVARVGGDGLDEARVAVLGRELHRSCTANACALAGLEIDEVRAGVYVSGAFDVSAAVVGRADVSNAPPPVDEAGDERGPRVARASPLDVDAVRSGDALIGLLDPSVHPRILAEVLGDATDGESSAGPANRDALETPQPSYRDAVAAICAAAAVRSAAYVGRTLFDDVPRALPRGVQAVFEPARWDVPATSAEIVRRCALDHDTAFRNLGMGIGFVLVVPVTDIAKALAASPLARVVGFVQPRRDDDPPVVVRAPRANR